MHLYRFYFYSGHGTFTEYKGKSLGEVLVKLNTDYPEKLEYLTGIEKIALDSFTPRQQVID